MLEHGRMRHLGWLIIGGAIGAFLLWRLGTVGQWLGVFLMGVAAWHAFKLVRTLIYPPGTIDLQGDTVVLPTGVCQAKALETSWDKVRHAYFLRRAVPWSRTGPILVVETDERILAYPRDWFRSDSDQRRVSQAIHRKINPA